MMSLIDLQRHFPGGLMKMFPLKTAKGGGHIPHCKMHFRAGVEHVTVSVLAAD